MDYVRAHQEVRHLARRGARAVVDELHQRFLEGPAPPPAPLAP